VVAATALLVCALADAGSVRIGTTVTDRQGRPVAGLTTRDFEIKEDGVAQKIDAVEPRKPEARRLAILLDEFHVDPADSARVRDALDTFVESRLRAGDVAVILKPLDPLTSIRLTADRDSLRRSIASFEGRKGLYEPRTPLEEETLGRAPALVDAGRAQVVLSALRALVSQLGSQPGRSAVLIVTEGFSLASRRSTLRGLPDAGVVERFANRYDVPIYAFDPRTPGPGDDDGSVMLTKLVSETGGTLSRGQDLASSVARAAGELDGGYTLVYTSAHGEDGRYHPVQVTIARRETDARTRAGYISPISPEIRRAQRAAFPDSPFMSGRLLRQSPLLRVWSGVTRMDGSNARVAVTWEPGSAYAGGKSPASRVELKATTIDGKVLYEGTLASVRAGSGAPGERAEFDAPAGRVQLDMKVLDVSGQKLDIDARDLEVPVPKAMPQLLPPVFIVTQSAREFREMSVNASATPDPAREFRRTERLIVRVPAYADGAPVPVTARLLNRVGQTMRDLDPMPNDAIGVAQFDLPLAALAPGDYFLLISIQGPTGPIAQRIPFKITG
jgi:VWFA-related protein